MNNCKEFVLDDLMAVTAIPVGNIPAGELTSPVNQLTPVIPNNAFHPSYADAITIGLRSAPGGVLVPIKRNTGKAKDDEGDNVAGRLHTVTVNCEVDGRDPDVWTHLLELERTPSHLVLTFRDGITQAFVAATRDTYTCTTERDGSKTSVAFRIQCLMGIQIIA